MIIIKHFHSREAKEYTMVLTDKEVKVVKESDLMQLSPAAQLTVKRRVRDIFNKDADFCIKVCMFAMEMGLIRTDNLEEEE
jgi:hypothetical protein